MENIISRQLFSRIEDNNWDAICEICCGQRPDEDIPQEHKHVFQLIQTLINEENVNHFVDYLKQYFSLAIDCYKNREEAICKVLVAVLATIDLEIKWNNNKVIHLFNKESKVGTHFKVLAFNCIFELLAQNYRNLTLNTNFDFNSFIEILLQNYNSFPEEIAKSFQLLLRIDYKLIDDKKCLQQIVIKCLPIDENSDELKSIKNQFLCTLFEVYFTLRKVLKIHQILIDKTNHLGSELCLNHHFLRLYGKCVLQLPFRQLIDLWKLFLDNFDINNIFLIQLLTSFLSHIRFLDRNIPLNLKEEMNQSFNETKGYLKKAIDFLKSNKNEVLTEHLLNLYFSWSSAMILQMTYSQNAINLEIIAKIKTNHWWDLSIIYDFTEDKVWKKIFNNCNQMRPTLQQIMIKLLIQKIQFLKTFQLKLDLSDDQKQVIQKSICEVISGLLKYDENKGTIINWLSSQQMELIISHSNDTLLCQISDSLIANIIESEEKQCFNIEKFLINSNIWENIEFQTAFVGSLWKKICVLAQNRKRKISEQITPKSDAIINSLVSNDSIWFECATDAPNCTKPSEMWSIIRDVSSRVEEMVQKNIAMKDILKIIKLMKVHSQCMPLEYLLPGNQMRCLLCLSYLLFSIDFSQESYQLLQKYILDSILQIFDGVRSVWLFNFVNPSHFIITTLKSLNHFKNIEMNRTLITRLIESVLRNTQSSALNIVELENIIIENEDKLTFEIILMSETILLKKCLQILNKKSIPKNMLQLKDSCGPLSHKLSNTIHNRVKKGLTNTEDLKSIDSVSIVDSFAAVFEFQISKSSKEESIHLKSKWRKLLSKLIDISINQLTVKKSANESCANFLILICFHRQKLTNILPEDFITNLWRVLSPSVDKTESSNAELVLNDFELIDVISQNERLTHLIEDINVKRDHYKQDFLESISTINCYNILVKPLFIELIKCTTSEEFGQIIESLIVQFRSNDYTNVSQLSFLWNSIFETEFHLIEEKNSIFLKVMDDLLITTAYHCQRLNQTDVALCAEMQIYIKVPLLQIIRSIIHMTTNIIKGPQLFMSYHVCIETSLTQFLSKSDIFIALFQSVYSILNEVLLQHKYLAISSMSTFNLIVQSLLKSLMMASNEQQFIEYDSRTQHDLELCSKNMDRLLTLMASFESEYSSYAPHLIASYVTQTQCVSVHQIVKKNILSGIYRVFKVITTKDSLEMIHSRLSQASREIFKVIYDNYEKYYKFKGQI